MKEGERERERAITPYMRLFSNPQLSLPLSYYSRKGEGWSDTIKEGGEEELCHRLLPSVTPSMR